MLEEAARLTTGARRRDYDHPKENFAKIAKMIEVLLDCDCTPRQVGLVMIGIKLIRDSHNPKRDNLVDAAGYANCCDMLDDDDEWYDDFLPGREVADAIVRAFTGEGVEEAERRYTDPYGPPTAEEWASILQQERDHVEGR